MPIRRISAVLVTIVICAGGWYYLRNYLAKREPPRIRIINSNTNLGIFRNGDGSKLGSFVITNDGGGVLVLKSIHAPCACLEPTLDRSRLGPGESALLAVTVNPARKPGPWSDTISVVCNDPEQPMVTLSMSAYIEAPIWSPDSDLRVVIPPERTAVDVKAVIYGPMNWIFQRQMVQAGRLENIQVVEISERKSMQPLVRKWTVSVRVHERGLSSWSNLVRIQTGGGSDDVLEIHLNVVEASKYQADPSIVFLSYSKPATVEIKSSTRNPSGVKATVQCPSWLECEVRRAGPSRWELQLLCKTRVEESGEIRIIFSDEHREFRIAVFSNGT